MNGDQELATRDSHAYYSILADFADLVHVFGALGVLRELATLFPVEAQALKDGFTDTNTGSSDNLGLLLRKK